MSRLQVFSRLCRSTRSLLFEFIGNWRPRPESNRDRRICSPLRNHSATRPRYADRPNALRMKSAPVQGQSSKNPVRSIADVDLGCHQHSASAYNPELPPFLTLRPNLTARRRRQRRTIGKSCDSTSKPSGIIQKPSIGKKPRIPPATSKDPKPTLNRRERGSPSFRLPSFTCGRERFSACAEPACSFILFHSALSFSIQRSAALVRIVETIG